MNFTYRSYASLIDLLKSQGYDIIDYHDMDQSERGVILRHDVDTSLIKALAMAELEHKLGVRSTYFLLLRTDFYNPASASSQEIIHKILQAGHEIGLHFDEAYYSPETDSIAAAIQAEAELMSHICRRKISAVSMHRPSRQTLEADLKIPGMINTYGKRFFQEIKYVSDSRRNWREPIEELIKNREYPKFQILVHPFWYYEEETSAHDVLYRFIKDAGKERYEALSRNIRDIEELLKENEIWS